MKLSRLYALGLLCVLLLGWELSARAFHVSALVLPAPTAVLAALWRGLSTGYLWPHIWQTSVELVLGLASGCVIGFASGVVMGESEGTRVTLK